MQKSVRTTHIAPAAKTSNEDFSTCMRRIAVLLSHYRGLLQHNVGVGRVASAPAAGVMT